MGQWRATGVQFQPGELRAGSDIYLLTLDPWGIAWLTTNAADDESPALSPDGGKVAFVSYRDGNAEIYVLDISSNALTRITSNAAADMDPAWSTDGCRLAFASDRGDNFDIYKVNADGTNLEKVAAVSNDGANDRWPDLGEYSGEMRSSPSHPTGIMMGIGRYMSMTAMIC